MDDRAFFGHPRGLSTLFFTEMWERFSYYGMRALLILFMTAPAEAGGLGLGTAEAGAVYGLYTAMVYLATLPGGWLADHLLGQRRAVLYGGVLIAAGHFSMAVPAIATFYLGLVLIVVGTGLLKGNVSVIVGRLYAPDDPRRDAGFSIFYMGINLGAFFAPLVCGYLGQRISWHAGFAAAGVGMLLGLVQFAVGSRHLGAAASAPAETVAIGQRTRQRTLAIRWSLGVGVTLAGLAFAVSMGLLPIGATGIADAAGYLLLAITVAFFGWLFLSHGWTREEHGRLVAIGVLFLGAALFWSVFEQAGTTLNLFADRSTRTTIAGFTFPSSWFQAVNSICIIACAPLFGWIWVALARRHREPSSATKFGIGLVLVGAGFAVLVPAALLAQSGARVSPLWLVATYVLHTWGELALSPVGLSAMSRLAPARISGLVMGVWFLAASAGNYIGGRVGGLYESWALPGLFTAVAAFGVIAGVLMLLLARPLARLGGDVS